MSHSDKVMFEIYREAGTGQQYRVVYYTELDEHDKDQEIRRAMAGEHFYDSFLLESRLEAAKEKVDEVLRRLNQGEKLSPQKVEAELERYLA